MSFTLSDIYPWSLCSPLSDLSLFSPLPDLSLLSLLSISLPLLISLWFLSWSLSLKREQRDRERKQRDNWREREQRESGGDWRMRERWERWGEKELTCATTWRRHRQEPPRRRTTRGVLILPSIGERYVFFFLLGAERGDNCKVAERTSERANMGRFSCHRPGEYEVIKSRLAP